MSTTLDVYQRQQDARILETLASAYQYTEHGHSINQKVPSQEVIRANIVQKITQALQQAYRHGDDKLQQQDSHEKKAPPARNHEDTFEMATALERHLFHTAATWEEYQDESTLNRRLQSLVYHFRRRRQVAWHSEKADKSLRRKVLGRIQDLIRKRLPCPLSESNEKEAMSYQVARMAQRVEEVLYREAQTRQEYANSNTITYRLHALALDYNCRAHSRHFHHDMYSL